MFKGILISQIIMLITLINDNNNDNKSSSNDKNNDNNDNYYKLQLLGKGKRKTSPNTLTVIKKANTQTNN